MTTLTRDDLKKPDDQQPMIIHPAFFGPKSDSTTNLIGDQLDFVDDESQSGNWFTTFINCKLVIRM